MNGMKSGKERAEEGRKLLEWGFRAFEPKALFEAGQTVGEAEVFGGEEDKVAAVPQSAVRLLVPRGGGKDLHFKATYSGPIQPPVMKAGGLERCRRWMATRSCWRGRSAPARRSSAVR
jgi:D-alanyl-D-alanine carboxypeptidase (penicillin-binding protein 5/6)